MTKVIVTGANGFVGSALVAQLARDAECRPIAAARHIDAPLPNGAEFLPISELGNEAEWRARCAGVDVVVHAAARVHMLKDQAADPLVEYRRTNVDASLAIARAAAAAGVRRFVFVSSIGVNGGETFDTPFSESSIPRPETPYAQSKLEAETGLLEIADKANMELVVVRPPLVYGDSAPGNFERLLRLIGSGLPMPLGLVRNRRSAIARENLVDFLTLCCRHPKAANQLFVIADGEDVSTPDLIRLLAAGMNRPARLVPIPMVVLRLAAKAVGRPEIFRQLCGSLAVDCNKVRGLLGWKPPISAATALTAAGAAFQNRTSSAK